MEIAAAGPLFIVMCTGSDLVELNIMAPRPASLDGVKKNCMFSCHSHESCS